MRSIARSPWLVQVLSAPAGAGKTTALRALATVVNRYGNHLMVLAPTGKAVDVALREVGGRRGDTIAKALQSLKDGSWEVKRPTPWSSSTKPPWSAPTTYANSWRPPLMLGSRPCWSATPTNWRR